MIQDIDGVGTIFNLAEIYTIHCMCIPLNHSRTWADNWLHSIESIEKIYANDGSILNTINSVKSVNIS